MSNLHSWSAADDQCDGSTGCEATIHLHGCYRDQGTNCDRPEEHLPSVAPQPAANAEPAAETEPQVIRRHLARLSQQVSGTVLSKGPALAHRALEKMESEKERLAEELQTGKEQAKLELDKLKERYAAEVEKASSKLTDQERGELARLREEVTAHDALLEAAYDAGSLVSETERKSESYLATRREALARLKDVSKNV